MKEFFEKKPLIGMVHLLPLPGTPNYRGSLAEIEDAAFKDMEALQEGGADAFILENFGDVPYGLTINDITMATMTTICAQIAKEAKIPYGVNVQFNCTEKEWALAYAINAKFIRVEAFVENRMGVHGVAYAAAPKLMRLRSQYSSPTMIFADINTKHTFPLTEQPIEFSVHEAISSGADALIVTELVTGKSPSIDDVLMMKTLAGDTPVILGSGINENNIQEYFKVADGGILGTSLKKDGDVNNRIDMDRVKQISELLKKQ